MSYSHKVNDIQGALRLEPANNRIQTYMGSTMPLDVPRKGAIWRRTAWSDRASAFLILPCVWVIIGERRGLWLRADSIVAGWGFARASVLRLRNTDPCLAKQPGWIAAGGPQLLEYLQKSKLVLDKKDVQSFFRNNQHWLEMARRAGLDQHYFRLILRSEIASIVTVKATNQE